MKERKRKRRSRLGKPNSDSTLLPACFVSEVDNGGRRLERRTSSG